MNIGKSSEYALVPDNFTGVIPKVVVQEGDNVKAGDALFVNKKFPEVKFSSPVSGTVTAVVRGDRRKVLCVKVKADDNQQFVDFGKKDVGSLDATAVKQSLLMPVYSVTSTSCLMLYQQLQIQNLRQFLFPHCETCH